MEKGLSFEQVPVTCPNCGNGTLKLKAQKEFAECKECGQQYPFVNGILDLLSHAKLEITPAEKPMLWKWLINLYNGRLWRESKWMAWSFGISFEKEREIIMKRARLNKNEMVFDLACGPGTYTIPFSRSVEKGFAVGLDLSMPMLVYAARKAREEVLENILFIHGTALNIPFPSNQFDVVNCCGALHLFPDLHSVLTKVHGILKSGGRFTLAAARQREGRFMHKLSAYLQEKEGLRSFTPSEMENILTQVGFASVACHHAKGSWLIMSAEKPA
jgi:ubiquinone/menaquinone biosynthesis C-methylase UbiE/uncharacterized protein YbaR (Trm112 family)